MRASEYSVVGDLSWLALIGVLTSIIQAAYFLRLINYMFARKPLRKDRLNEPRNLLIPVLILTATIILLGIYPTIILKLIEPVIQQIPLIP